MSTVADDLKQHIDIIDVIGRYVELKRTGSNYTGLCPFHHEKSPSFMVSREKQIFKCFGCGIGGDSIAFIMEHDKLDFWDALKELSHRFHFDLTPYERQYSSANDKDQRQKLKLINSLSSTRFHEQLLSNTDALTYMTDKRKLSKHIIARWGLGYAPQGNGLITHLQSRGFTAQDLMESGVAKQGSGGDMYSFFRHRVLFPIHDHAGNVVAFGGRIINPEDTPKYLNTTETSIYQKSKVLYGLHHNKSGFKEFGKAIIVEGYMDVIALDRIGFPIGVAPCGTSLSGDHIKLLSRHTKNIVALFDNDSAGQTAGLRSIKLLLEHGVYPRVILLPQGMKDADDVANSNLSSEEQQAIITTDIDWFDACMKRLQTQYPLEHPVSAKQCIHEMFAVLTHISDYSVFMGYMNKLASIVHIDEHGLTNQYKQRYRSHKRYTNTSSEQTKKYEEDQDMLLLALDQHGSISSFATLYQLAQNLAHIKQVGPYSDDQINEGVLWRNRALSNLSEEGVHEHIKQFLMRYLQTNSSLIIKLNTLTLDEKHDLLQQIKTTLAQQ